MTGTPVCINFLVTAGLLSSGFRRSRFLINEWNLFMEFVFPFPRSLASSCASVLVFVWSNESYGFRDLNDKQQMSTAHALPRKSSPARSNRPTTATLAFICHPSMRPMFDSNQRHHLIHTRCLQTGVHGEQRRVIGATLGSTERVRSAVHPSDGERDRRRWSHLHRLVSRLWSPHRLHHLAQGYVLCVL